MGLTTNRLTPEAAYDAGYDHARAMGLNRKTARAYGQLAAWLAHDGERMPPIVSGYRPAWRQRALQERWDRGDRAGLVVRPAHDSKHSRREAFDLQRSPLLRKLGAWAPAAGLRWGGTFQKRDDVHFDLR